MPALLWHNKHRLPLPRAVQLALREFRHAGHTAGLTARQCRLNPQQLPAGTESLHGLRLVADPQVPPDHLRICPAEGVTSGAAGGNDAS